MLESNALCEKGNYNDSGRQRSWCVPTVSIFVGKYFITPTTIVCVYFLYMTVHVLLHKTCQEKQPFWEIINGGLHAMYRPIVKVPCVFVPGALLDGLKNI